MSDTRFVVMSLGKDGYAINDRNRTVALLPPCGNVDWLLRSPAEPGELITTLRKETHLSYTLGLKFTLFAPLPCDRIVGLDVTPETDGARVRLSARSISGDGAFTTQTVAVLSVAPETGCYVWDLETIIACIASAPTPLPGIEYNNVYPSRAYRGILYGGVKDYSGTLAVDRDSVAWIFPHQHFFTNYNLGALRFAPGALAGFFGEPDGAPVVRVLESRLEPTWGICDMYYDLHCCVRTAGAMQPGEQVRVVYRVEYLDGAAAGRLLAGARPGLVTEQDRRARFFPRLELGLNTFKDHVQIDRLDDACWFRTSPPQCVWDRGTARTAGGGSLCVAQTIPGELIWRALPPSHIPPGTRLRVNGWMKTARVAGKGAFLRVRSYTFVFKPVPGVEWYERLESVPVTGTTNTWTRIQVPDLVVPEEYFDHCVELALVLDGVGTAWLTDLELIVEPLGNKTAAAPRTDLYAKLTTGKERR